MAENGEQENDGHFDLIKYWGAIAVWILLFITVLIGLFKPSIITITWQIVALIGILLAIPYLQDVKRIWFPNLGGIDFSDDIRNVERQVDNLLSNLEGDYDITLERRSVQPSSAESDDRIPEDETQTTPQPEELEVEDLGGDPETIANSIYSLLDESPRAALAKLRMETEEALRNYLFIRDFPVDNSTPAHQMTEYVSEDDYLDSEFFDTYLSVRDLCNRAIHGEAVETSDAVDIVQLGIDLIKYLNEMSKRTEEDKQSIGEFEES